MSALYRNQLTQSLHCGLKTLDCTLDGQDRTFPLKQNVLARHDVVPNINQASFLLSLPARWAPFDRCFVRNGFKGLNTCLESQNNIGIAFSSPHLGEPKDVPTSDTEHVGVFVIGIEPGAIKRVVGRLWIHERGCLAGSLEFAGTSTAVLPNPGNAVILCEFRHTFHKVCTDFVTGKCLDRRRFQAMIAARFRGRTHEEVSNRISGMDYFCNTVSRKRQAFVES